MAYVFLVSGKITKQHLAKAVGLPGEKRYFIWDEGGLPQNWTEGTGFQRLDIISSEDDKKRFSQEYIDLIGTLSVRNHSRLWWATDLASKNTFISGLQEIFYRYFKLLEALRSSSFGCLIIAGFPGSVLSSLRMFLKRNGFSVTCLGRNYEEKIRREFLLLRKRLGLFYHALRAGKRAVVARRVLGCRIKKNIDPAGEYLIFKTFVYDGSFKQDGSYRDSFFGCLPQQLKDKKNVVILADIQGNFRYCLRKIRALDDIVIFPWEMFLSSADILTALKDVLLYKADLPAEVFLSGENVGDILCKESDGGRGGIQLYQYLHYAAVSRMLKIMKSETFAYTFENNPWERMCVTALRDHSPKTKIIGYQHTVVPPAFLNFLISPKEQGVAPLPDKILTVGETARDLMSAYGGYPTGLLETFCALRYDYNYPAAPRQKRGHILVALDGVHAVLPLIDYVWKHLGDACRYQTLIRPHPALPWRYYERKIGYDVKKAAGIRISESCDLESDLEWADIVIYWGSTVACAALAMGKPVIAWQGNTVLSYDPMPDCRDLKWPVMSQDDLVPVIERIYSLDNASFLSQQNRAREYIHRYFIPGSNHILNNFIDIINSIKLTRAGI